MNAVSNADFYNWCISTQPILKSRLLGQNHLIIHFKIPYTYSIRNNVSELYFFEG